MTATSFTSVSMDPPQILVCLNETTETGAAILENKNFAVKYNIFYSALDLLLVLNLAQSLFILYFIYTSPRRQQCQ
jgi:hypothetical protein